jgi:hypothetical protein
MTIPNVVKEALPLETFERDGGDRTADDLGTLNVPKGSLFFEFYMTYHGAFGSPHSGFVILDIPEILEETAVVRDEFDFPSRYLVLTELLGGSVLIYDVETDHVFSVDFEGGDELLLKGELEPDWTSFEGFLEDFFKR